MYFTDFILPKCILILIMCCIVPSLSSQTTYIDENFDTGIPGTWTIYTWNCATIDWKGTTSGYRGGGSYLDGTEFIIVDSDVGACVTAAKDSIIKSATHDLSRGLLIT